MPELIANSLAAGYERYFITYAAPLEKAKAASPTASSQKRTAEDN